MYLYKILFSKISNYKYENKKQNEILEKNIREMKDYVDQLSSNSKNMIKYRYKRQSEKERKCTKSIKFKKKTKEYIPLEK